MMDAVNVLTTSADALGIPLGMPPARRWYRHPTKGMRFAVPPRKDSRWNANARALIASAGCTSTLRKTERSGATFPSIDKAHYLHSSRRAA